MELAGVLDRIVNSRINYWGGYVLDVVGVAFFLFYGLAHSSSGAAACIASGLGGLVLWTLLEYLLHRFIFHGPPSSAKRGHSRHHQHPKATVASPMVGIATLIVILWFLLKLVMPADLASFIAMGIVMGHLHFAVLHHVLHHWPGSARHLARLHHYHEVHHRVPRVNYGSTTMIWDRLFGTFNAGKPN